MAIQMCSGCEYLVSNTCRRQTPQAFILSTAKPMMGVSRESGLVTQVGAEMGVSVVAAWPPVDPTKDHGCGQGVPRCAPKA
jgi:hypothetical protein